MKVEIWAFVNEKGKPVNTTTLITVAEEWMKRGKRVVHLTNELPEPKKKVRLAPALCGWKKNNKSFYYRTANLYANEADAKEAEGAEFICWPMPAPDENGFIEVEVES